MRLDVEWTDTHDLSQLRSSKKQDSLSQAGESLSEGCPRKDPRLQEGASFTSDVHSRWLGVGWGTQPWHDGHGGSTGTVA